MLIDFWGNLKFMLAAPFLQVLFQNHFLWSLATPVFFLICLYCFVTEKLGWFYIVLGILISISLVGCIVDRNIVFFLNIALSLFLVFLVRSFRDKLDGKIREAETRKKAMLEEKAALSERYEVRMESLNHLERQVSGLVKLFEMARDFNDCLSFSSLISVIEQKIVRELDFVRGTLVLVDNSDDATDVPGQPMSFGAERTDSEKAEQELSEKYFNLVSQKNQILRFDDPGLPEAKTFRGNHVKFPLWLFPLSIEHRLIAILAIEGGTQGDFPKFEIFSSQLALHVKKIRLYETVKEISIIDGLTNVFVRRHFLERFQEEIRRAMRFQFPLSVLMVDVDHFKSYNDKYGHLVGDKALREVAQIVRDNIRRVDVLGRFGGEEFVIVAPEINKTKALELAERIRSAVARSRLKLYDEETQITISIGISSFPEDLKQPDKKEVTDTDITELIDKADQALYKAKQEGRNRVVGFS